MLQSFDINVSEIDSVCRWGFAAFLFDDNWWYFPVPRLPLIKSIS